MNNETAALKLRKKFLIRTHIGAEYLNDLKYFLSSLGAKDFEELDKNTEFLVTTYWQNVDTLSALFENFTFCVIHDGVKIYQ